MNEKLQGLKATLRELEAELAQVDGLDDSTRSMLEEAAQEITDTLSEYGTLDQADSESGSDAAQDPQRDNGNLESHSARSKLEEVVGEFETSHPTLYGLINRLVDALGQMGI